LSKLHALNALGIAFIAGQAIGGITDRVEVFRLIAVSSMQAPGQASGVNYSSFNSHALNDAGQVAFGGRLTGTGVSGSTSGQISSEGSGSGLTVIARQGSQTAGLPASINYSLFLDGLGINDTGQALFVSQLSGTGSVNAGNDTAIFREDSDVSVIAREGDQAPGLDEGVRYSTLMSPSFNDSGQTAFLAMLAGDAVTGANNGVIYSAGSGSGLVPIAREGDQIAGMNPGVLFGSTTAKPVLNNVGQAAFVIGLTGAGVLSTNDQAIFLDRAGSGITCVAREGDQVAGLTEDVRYGQFYIDLAFNDFGMTALRGTIVGAGVDETSNDVIYQESPGGGLTVLVREGDQAAGLPPTVRYTDFESPVLNNAGQTAFYAELFNDVAFFNGIFATDLSGQMLLVAAEGTRLDINPDPLVNDFRVISSLSSDIVLNNAGELAFRATFTDGTSGIYVASVPAPGAVGLFGVMGLVAVRRRR